MKQIEIYTDGSCRGNPGPGGWAAIFLEISQTEKKSLAPVVHEKSKKSFAILKGRAHDTTNNRMEMTAVIEALRYVDHKKMHNAQITLFSDSNLIIQTVLQGWKRKANLDLWEELDELNEELDISYRWVKGHAKNYWNNECDKVAQSESDAARKTAPAAPASAKATTKRKNSEIQTELF